MTNPQFLLIMIAVVTAVSGFTWLLMAYPLRVWAKASLHFSATNLLALLGVLLMYQGSESTQPLYRFVIDALFLTAFFLFHSGIIRLFRLQQVLWPAVTVLITAILGLLFIQLGTASDKLNGIVFSAAAVILFVMCGRNIVQAIQPDYGLRNAIFMAIPAQLMALLFALRVLLFWFAPSESQHYIGFHSSEGSMMLWAFIALSITININMAGCAMVRLISRIRFLAERDQLTGLLNRRAMRQRLEQQHQSWLRHQFPYSLIWLDLDHFKQINDRLGHAAGDAALKHCAQVLQSALRDHDVLCRHGGEEFLIILPGLTQSHACQAAERLRQLLAQSPMEWQGEKIALTASLGVISSQSQLEPEQLLHQADAAMYQAKEAGRNRCQLAAVETPSEV